MLRNISLTCQWFMCHIFHFLADFFDFISLISQREFPCFDHKIFDI